MPTNYNTFRKIIYDNGIYDFSKSLKFNRRSQSAWAGAAEAAAKSQQASIYLFKWVCLLSDCFFSFSMIFMYLVNFEFCWV